MKYQHRKTEQKRWKLKNQPLSNMLKEENHTIQFEKTDVLATTSNYYPKLFREAVEIHKHMNKKEEGQNVDYSIQKHKMQKGYK